MPANPRIILAALIGIVMVAGAYWLSLGQDTQTVQTDTPVVVSASSIRHFVPVTDGDGDGLPDWQNSLRYTSVGLDSSTGTSSSTQTAIFATELAKQALGGYGLTSNSLGTNQSLTKEFTDTPYVRQDINVGSDTSIGALRAYGNAVATVAISNAPPRGTENELTILNRALVRNDPDILKGLDPVIASYENMVKDMLRVSVPSTLVKEHLSLINVYQALLNDIRSFRTTFEDAMPSMVRFRRYQADVEALYLAISALYLKLDQAGIAWTDADMATKFISIE